MLIFLFRFYGLPNKVLGPFLEACLLTGRKLELVGSKEVVGNIIKKLLLMKILCFSTRMYHTFLQM